MKKWERSAGRERCEFQRFEEWWRCCHGPSVPVQHAGRKMRAPWPARPKTARKKKPTTPVGMTEIGNGKPKSGPPPFLRQGERRRALQRQEEGNSARLGRRPLHKPAENRGGTGTHHMTRQSVYWPEGQRSRGTCPFVQGILGASEPQVRGITHPSMSRGAEPECQL